MTEPPPDLERMRAVSDAIAALLAARLSGDPVELEVARDQLQAVTGG